MYPNQSLHTWPPMRRRTRTRFPAASPKTALSTTRGGIIAVMTRSANGSKRRTNRYALQMVDVQTHGDEVTVRARLTGEFPGSPVELDYIFKLSNNKIASLEIRSLR